MKENIERMRNNLYKAADMKVSYELLLEISQKLDRCIVEYLREKRSQKGDLNGGKKD
ncbi:MAG TPA: Spo0E family sporulation regulatory protein-aspartic acid phosphatase [Clostridia bacterium]|jgi:hypothetical protein|nr:aspartyl-phosphate phosphatase Spo0E family protein [Clostridia bacterium]HHY05652.1 Spo0E family sporulation regulatory protein-aspartic acid phosphatase [Clostridia bacterium]